MKSYASHDEYLADIRALIEQWCDQRRLYELALLLPGYLAINGLTDGWAALSDALKKVRAFNRETLTPAECDLVNDLIHQTDKIVYRF
jgi:hypothetical protein